MQSSRGRKKSVEGAKANEPVKKQVGRMNVILTVPKSFRCFEPATKKMYYEQELLERGVVMTPFGKLIFAPTGESLEGALIPLWNTTQQDADGKPLYEGDICEIDVDTGFGSVTQRVGIMRWAPEYNAFSIHFNGRSMQEGQVRITRAKRIGNEYQDAEAAKRYREDNE